MKVKELFEKIEEIETIAKQARKDPDKEVYLDQIKLKSRRLHSKLYEEFPEDELMDKELGVIKNERTAN